MRPFPLPIHETAPVSRTTCRSRHIDLCRHRLAEAAAACNAAISVLRVEHGIDKWYQRCFVNILVSHDVTEVVIAFIDVHPHRFKSVAGVVSLQFRGKDTNKK